MKKILMMGIAAIAAMAMTDARALSLTDAGAKVPEAAEKPATMAEVMNQLSEADQLKFLATVNEAIAKMPISEDEKVARYVEANTAAVRPAVGPCHSRVSASSTQNAAVNSSTSRSLGRIS